MEGIHHRDGENSKNRGDSQIHSIHRYVGNGLFKLQMNNRKIRFAEKK